MWGSAVSLLWNRTKVTVLTEGAHLSIQLLGIVFEGFDLVELEFNIDARWR